MGARPIIKNRVGTNSNNYWFSFIPKIFWLLGRIISYDSGDRAGSTEYFLTPNKQVQVSLVDWRYIYTEYTLGGLDWGSGGAPGGTYTKKAENSLYWYNANTDYMQFNQSNYKYFWISFG